MTGGNAEQRECRTFGLLAIVLPRVVSQSKIAYGRVRICPQSFVISVAKR